jgi:hypothetical protein
MATTPANEGAQRKQGDGPGAGLVPQNRETRQRPLHRRERGSHTRGPRTASSKW